MTTDWTALDTRITEVEAIEFYGTARARKALELILGDEWIEATVEQAISSSGGNENELALNCLSLLASTQAAQYAYKIYRESEDNDRKSMAVWLIKHLKVEASFVWVEEFLHDPNVMLWGIGVLDQLLWSRVVDYEEEYERVDVLLELALKNSNGALAEHVAFIRNFLDAR